MREARELERKLEEDKRVAADKLASKEREIEEQKRRRREEAAARMKMKIAGDQEKKGGFVRVEDPVEALSKVKLGRKGKHC